LQQTFIRICLGKRVWDIFVWIGSSGTMMRWSENAVLEAPFSEEEVRAAIFSSYAEGAHVLMGYNFCFTINFGM
jgi:hypothetical protein